MLTGLVLFNFQAVTKVGSFPIPIGWKGVANSLPPAIYADVNALSPKSGLLEGKQGPSFA
jgi:hypothetical protein